MTLAFESPANYQLSRPISGHLATFACPRFRNPVCVAAVERGVLFCHERASICRRHAYS
jgi:hypothetical protein